MKHKFKEISEIMKNITVYKFIDLSALKSSSSKLAAFTLAEVLITLGIIGIVAAITIPGLIAKQKEKVACTKVKEAYSILSQAYRSALAEYGDATGWELYNNSTGSKNFGTKLVPYLKLAYDCGLSSNSTNSAKCWVNKKMKYITGAYFNGERWNLAKQGNYYKIMLLNGMSMAFTTRSENCTATAGTSGTYCGYILVDIDGPNSGDTKLGEDIFQFWIREDGIVPSGIPSVFTDSSVDKEGWRAAYYILKNKKMDYLKSPYTRLQNKYMR